MKYCPVCKSCYEDTEDRCVKDRLFLIEAFPGERIVDGKYRIDALIGQGGMGAVYKATHLELDRVIALKVVLPDFVSSTETLERFRREARAAARLNHPNVITIYDFGVLQNGRAYLAMELLTGKSLRDEIEKQGYITPVRALEILKPICNAVQAAHNAGVIHRDLKPDNIVIEKNDLGVEIIKVVDFGIAKLREHTGQKVNSLTGPGLVMGTPHYMSPEQCKGEDLDVRSDIYSLGVMLYEMLCGHVPFDAPTPSAVIIQHAIDPPRRLGLLRKDIPPQVEEVVMKALSKSRQARQQTVIELYEEMRNALHSQPVEAAKTVDPVVIEDETSTEFQKPRIPTAPHPVSQQTTLSNRESKEPPPIDHHNTLDDEADELRELSDFHEDQFQVQLCEAGSLIGHEHVVRSLCYSPDGHLLVSASADGVIKIWDLQKLMAIGSLHGHELAVNSLAISPDGTKLVSASSDGTVKLWDLAKEAEIAKLHSYSGTLRAVAFSPNGRLVAVANEDNIDLWDVESRQRLAQFTGHAKLVEDVEFSRDSQLIISAGADETVRFWDPAGKIELEFISSPDHCINVLSSSVDGILATGGKDGTIRLWDIASRSDLAILEGHTQSIRALNFSTRGDYLVSGDWGGVVKLWDTATGIELTSIEAHDGAVMAATFSPDEKQVATAGYDQIIKLWSIQGLPDF